MYTTTVTSTTRTITETAGSTVTTTKTITHNTGVSTITTTVTTKATEISYSAFTKIVFSPTTTTLTTREIITSLITETVIVKPLYSEEAVVSLISILMNVASVIISRKLGEEVICRVHNVVYVNPTQTYEKTLDNEKLKFVNPLNP